MKAARGSSLANLLLILGGALLGLLALEIGLRVYWYPAAPGSVWNSETPAESERWAGHPFLPYAGKPNAAVDLFSGPAYPVEHIRHNSYGFRSHEFPARKTPKDFRILCLGGSTTYGYRVESNDQTWPELLEQKLATRYPDRTVQVFNLGLDMATTAVSVVNFALVGAHLQPDLVIPYEGYNDLSALGYRNFRTDHAHFYANINPDDVWRGFQANLPRWMLRSYVIFQASGALDMLFGVNDLTQAARQPRIDDSDAFKGLDTTLENLRTLHSIAQASGAQTLFATFQFRDGEDESYQHLNDAFRGFFEANGFMYVDQDRLIPNHDPTINMDQCHFTPKGNDMLAQNFVDYIVAHHLIKDRGEPTPKP